METADAVVLASARTVRRCLIFLTLRIPEAAEVQKHLILFHHLAVILALLVRTVNALRRVPNHLGVVLMFTFAAYPMLLHILRRALGLWFVFRLCLGSDLVVLRLTVRPAVCQIYMAQLGTNMPTSSVETNGS